MIEIANFCPLLFFGISIFCLRYFSVRYFLYISIFCPFYFSGTLFFGQLFFVHFYFLSILFFVHSIFWIAIFRPTIFRETTFRVVTVFTLLYAPGALHFSERGAYIEDYFWTKILGESRPKPPKMWLFMAFLGHFVPKIVKVIKYWRNVRKNFEKGRGVYSKYASFLTKIKGRGVY